MKKQLQTIVFAIVLTFCSFNSFGNAEIQIIHNAADPTLASVDVYVKGFKVLDNVAFRTATSFLSVPSGTLDDIGIAPSNSTSVNDTIANFPVLLAGGQRYAIIVGGVANPANFAVNPDGRSRKINFFIKSNIKNAASSGSVVEFVAMHGATDAPTVDVIARGVATLVNDAAYGDITSYITVPAASYTLDVTLAAGTPIVASYTADLSTLGGGSAVVFASGFLTPATNQNGPAFGLYAALANGTVVAFPPVSKARLQVIHNAADPAAASVDVYVNGNLLLNNFAFRTATPYVDVPAGVLLNIGVAPGNSTSAADTLKNFQVTLANGGTYLAVANGVLNPGSFAANPDAKSTGFTLFLQDQMKESASNGSNVDFRAVHGATDAPTVDVIARGVATLVNDAFYGAITPYITVPAASYTLDVTLAAGTPIVASYAANLSTLGGGSAVVFASGFLTPSTNQNGPAFGLFAALANGTVVQFNNVTGIEENRNAAAFSMYPNPANDEINIITSSIAGRSTIEITNSIGQFIKSCELNAFKLTIPVADLPRGVYFVKVQNSATSSIYKLIIN